MANAALLLFFLSIVLKMRPILFNHLTFELYTIAWLKCHTCIRFIQTDGLCHPLVGILSASHFINKAFYHFINQMANDDLLFFLSIVLKIQPILLNHLIFELYTIAWLKCHTCIGFIQTDGPSRQLVGILSASHFINQAFYHFVNQIYCSFTA